MWILETEPPRWLAPNKTYTVGRRTQRDQVDFISMEGTSISRNHLSIQIGDFNPESVNSITSVKLTDLKSKFGTQVNGETLKSSKTLVSSPIELTLGPSSSLKLVWKPIIISFSTGEKQQAQKVMWNHATRALGPLDIKLCPNIIPSTTHFMKGTHLTSKLALALALNLPILNVQFLDAIQSVAPELELDFGKWPEESQFLGDPLWAPNDARSKCFRDQKFVVYEESQYRNLAPVMDATGGTIRLVSPSDTVGDDEILIKPQDKSLASGPNQKLFTDHSDILEAIKRGVPVKPQANTRKRPQRAGLMDFLTSSSQPAVAQNTKEPTQVKFEEETPQEPTQESQPSQRKRPARVTMMDHMVNPKRHKPDPAKIGGEEQLKTPHMSENLPQPVQKRARVDQESLFVEDQRVTKPRAAPASTQVSVRSTQPNNQEDAGSFIDLDCMVPGLALVECTLDVVSKPQPSRQSGSQWQGRPNFKAFRRKGTKKSDVPATHDSTSCFSWSVYDSHNTTTEMGFGSVPVTPEPEISFVETDNLPAYRPEPEADAEFGFTFS